MSAFLYYKWDCYVERKTERKNENMYVYVRVRLCEICDREERKDERKTERKSEKTK